MIGPVSGTGRAMMASLQQAIQKGMPPDQAIQYVKSMAVQGVAPLADLYAMMNQFQRLKQPQAQPPQTPPTIRDQLNMLDQQSQMQERAMTQGLGAVNAGVMENPRFAGGGIVAFDEGGDVLSFGSRDEYESWLKNNKEVQRILRKGPAARTPEENEILRNAGIELFRRTFAKKEPSIPYADAAPVVKPDSGIDFSKMSREQLEMLAKSEDRTMARAAYGEYLRRSGYRSPGQLLSDAGEGIGQFVANTRIAGGAPDYMRDEQGRIRTPGMGGPVAYSLTEGIVPLRREVPPAVEGSTTPGPVVTPFSSPQDAGAAFDRALATARAGVPQDERPTAISRDNVGARRAATSAGGVGGGIGGGEDAFSRLISEVEKRKFQEIPDEYTPEEKKRIEKDLAKLPKEKENAARMALARAGFSMAAAASRAGRQRTTALGALAEGAMGGIEQYAASQKELRQVERELNKEMSSLRRYQDEVARGERKENRTFEENKFNTISDLTARRESARINREEIALRERINREDIASRERIVNMQYGEASGQNAYRRSALTISGLEPMLKAAQERLNAISTIPPVDIKTGSPEHKALIAAAQREVDSLKAELRAAFSGGSGSAVPTTTFPNLVDYSSLK